VFAWKFVPDQADPNKTHVTYIIGVDPKGSIPGAIYNAFVSEQAQTVLKAKNYIEK